MDIKNTVTQQAKKLHPCSVSNDCWRNTVAPALCGLAIGLILIWINPFGWFRGEPEEHHCPTCPVQEDRTGASTDVDKPEQ